MYNSKLLDLLRILDNKEILLLKSYIQSSHGHKDDATLKLFTHLVKIGFYHPSKLEKTYIFRHLFSKEPFNDAKLRHVMSYLFEQVEGFLISQTIANKRILADSTILGVYKERNAIRQFSLREKRIKQSKKKNIKLNSQVLLSNYLVSQEKQAFYATKERSNTQYINTLQEDLDIFYFTEKLKTACSALNLQKVLNKAIDEFFLNPVLRHLEVSKYYKKNLLLELYYRGYQLLSAPTNNNFNLLLNFIKNNLNNIEAAELKGAFNIALNYSIGQINQGKEQGLKSIFDLYSFGVESSLLLDQKNLTYVSYSNYVTVGLRLKKYNQVLRFIEDQKQFLKREQREDYYIFNISKYYFALENYERVTTLYYQHKVKEDLLDIQSRFVQIKSFYELSAYELCQSLNDNLRQLIHRKRLLKHQKENYKNNALCIKQLLNINPYDKKRIKKFEEKIKTIHPMTEKQWILEKIREL